MVPLQLVHLPGGGKAAPREEHGPLVESRVPLKDYPRVATLLHARR
ncbi:MAG: hypothetical protein IPN17_28560 [Deltaproteobacteria bacterium]|nr:hypothetical protein [Deltaproteobacteria bacterium]